MILSFDAGGHLPGLTPWWLGAVVLALLCYGLAGFLGEGAGPDEAARHGALSTWGPRRLGRVGLWCGWSLHSAVIVFDVAGASTQAARFGFAPALSVTVWLVLAVYAIESRFLPLTGVRRILAGCAIVSMAMALAFPGELVSQVAPWAPVHWVLGIASYGLFGAAVLHAVLLNQAEKRLRQKSITTHALGLPLLQLERLTFRFVAAGFSVLTAALVLGWWLTPAWRWDHKVVFSLCAWALFAALLLGRYRFGWRGLQATRWLYVGAALLFLAYVGSRFVLEVLIHPR